jgi:hypothetical protein
MRLWIIASAGIIALTPIAALALDGYGQISLENKTSATADLYVDGAYGCRALAGLLCTTQVSVGTHNLEAKLTDGRSTTQDGVVIGQGESRTWTISES